VSTARRRARSGAKGVRGPGAVHLVDASPYVFRAWFALKTPILSPAGADVGAVLGFAGFLLRHLADHAPTHVAVAFDESLTTSFRNELYAGYKAGRETPPPELVTQLAACRAAAEVLGCATFADARYEADDLIATWCRRLARVRRPIVVVSPDKDLMQLVDGRVELLDAARGLRYGPDDVPTGLFPVRGRVRQRAQRPRKLRAVRPRVRGQQHRMRWWRVCPRELRRVRRAVRRVLRGLVERPVALSRVRSALQGRRDVRRR
jgi:hypothetical protein